MKVMSRMLKDAFWNADKDEEKAVKLFHKKSG